MHESSRILSILHYVPNKCANRQPSETETLARSLGIPSNVPGSAGGTQAPTALLAQRRPAARACRSCSKAHAINEAQSLYRGARCGKHRSAHVAMIGKHAYATDAAPSLYHAESHGKQLSAQSARVGRRQLTLVAMIERKPWAQSTTHQQTCN